MPYRIYKLEFQEDFFKLLDLNVVLIYNIELILNLHLYKLVLIGHNYYNTVNRQEEGDTIPASSPVNQGSTPFP